MDKMMANITPEDDTNIESTQKEIESKEYEVEKEVGMKAHYTNVS